MDIKEICVELLGDIEALGMRDYQPNQVRPMVKNMPVDVDDTTLRSVLDYLRVSIQYRCLDLEATRRDLVDVKDILAGKGDQGKGDQGK